MVWTSKNGPKCPVSPEDRGEEPAQRSYPEGATVAWRWRVSSFYDWHYTTYKPDNVGANEIEPLYTAPQPVAVAQTAQRPLAWRYELAGARFWNNDDTPGEYTNWVWRVSDSEPNAGDGMRNVTPLYALPSTDHK